MKTSFLVIPAFLGAFALNTGISFAAECGEGHVMHAKILDVDPALFTENDLIALDAAVAAGDTDAAQWIKDRAQRAEVSRGNATYCEFYASN